MLQSCVKRKFLNKMQNESFFFTNPFNCKFRTVAIVIEILQSNENIILHYSSLNINDGVILERPLMFNTSRTNMEQYD